MVPLRYALSLCVWQGLDDIVASLFQPRGKPSIVVYFATGTLLQPFGNAVVLSGGTVSGANAVALADMDGDGDIDVITAGTQSGNIAWLQNNGMMANPCTVTQREALCQPNNCCWLW